MIQTFKKIWTSETNGVTTAAIIIASASFASRVIGVLRDRVLASTFGAGSALDTYYAAFRLPDMLYNLLILGALSAGFIPVFAEYLATKSKDEAWKLVGHVISTLGTLLVFFCIVLFFIAPYIIPLITPGFDPEKMSTTIHLTRIMLLSPFFMGLSGIMGGVLQTTRRFFAFSIAPIFYNCGIIFGAVVLSQLCGIEGVAYGVIIGAFLHFFIQAIVAWPMGIGILPWPSFSNPGLHKISLLMAPRTIGLAISQVNLVFLTGFASYLSAGSVSIMNLANNLQSFPVGIIGVSYAVAVFPLFALSATKKDVTAFLHHLEHTVRKILFIIIPITVLFLLLRAQIVRLVLGAGSFDWDDTVRTANVLGIFVISLPAQALIPLFARAFYAYQDSRTPLISILCAELTNVLIAFFSYRTFGVLGLASAFTISSWVNVGLLYSMWIHTHPALRPRFLWFVLLTSVASSAMLIVGYACRQIVGTIYPLHTFIQVALQAITATMAGCGMFLFIAHILRIEEMGEMMHAIRRLRMKSDIPIAGAEEVQGIS